MISPSTDARAWVELLEDEDLAFLKRFLLSSGSLKDVAQVYGISYPTIRQRLNRLIAKIHALDSNRGLSPLERLVRAYHAEGRIDLATMKGLLEAHRGEEKDAG